MAKNKKMTIAGTSLVVQGLGLHPSNVGTSLVVQGLRLHASNVGGMGLIPGQRTKILHAMQWD